MSNRSPRAGAALLCLCLCLGILPAQEIVFPPHLSATQGLVDVRRDAGAKGDGVTDDTEAFRRAMLLPGRKPGIHHLIYVPRGTYLLSGPILWQKKNAAGAVSWGARIQLVGQDRDTTILKLKDACGLKGAMLVTGADNAAKENGAGNTAFSNCVQNLTVDVGSGNPGASGIDFIANNNGSVRDCLIRAGENSGSAGILMVRGSPGPALVKNVEIQGFSHAVLIGCSEYSMTFDHLICSGQRVSAVKNTGNQCYMRRVSSRNRVPFYLSGHKGGPNHSEWLVLYDSTLEGGDPDQTAITITPDKVVLREVKVGGYGKILSSAEVKAEAGKAVSFLLPTATKSTGTGQAQPLRLPMVEIPEPRPYPADFSQWADVTAFGATPFNSSDDDAVGIQKAVDSGAKVVVIPQGKYNLKQPVRLRGQVEKVLGIGLPSLTPSATFCPLVAERTASGAVELSGLVLRGDDWDAPGLLGDGPVDITTRLCQFSYLNTAAATGRLFIEDCMLRVNMEHPQDVFALQYNAEHARPLISLVGGRVNIFGMKTEMGAGKGAMLNKGHRTIVMNRGGELEINGFHMIWLADAVPKTWTDIGPMILNQGGRTAILGYHHRGPLYPESVRDQQGGEWKSLRFDDCALFSTVAGP